MVETPHAPVVPFHPEGQLIACPQAEAEGREQDSATKTEPRMARPGADNLIRIRVAKRGRAIEGLAGE